MSRPLFERRHYEALALCFSSSNVAFDKPTLLHILRFLKRDNPAFNIARFMEACGHGPEAAKQWERNV